MFILSHHLSSSTAKTDEQLTIYASSFADPFLRRLTIQFPRSHLGIHF